MMAGLGNMAGGVRLLVSAALLAMVQPLAPAAMVPVLECDISTSLTDAERIYDGYAAQYLPESVVAYRLNRLADDALVFIVEHCPSGTRMTATAAPVPGEGAEQARSRMWAVEEAVQNAIDAPQSYTLRQLARLAERAGAVARVGQAEYESCACQQTGN